MKGEIKVPKEVRACVYCGGKSPIRYPRQFRYPNGEYVCKECAPKHRKNALQKEIRKCNMCGKETYPNYPSQFPQPQETYLCSGCYVKTQEVPKGVWGCVDCGKKSSPKKPCDFDQPKDQYRCKECSDIKRYLDRSITPKFTEETRLCIYCGKESTPRIKSQFRQQDYICKECIHQDIGWKTNQNAAIKLLWQDPEYRAYHRMRTQEMAQNPNVREHILVGRNGQGFWYGHPILCPENREKEYCELWCAELWRRIDAAWNYKSAFSGKTRWDTPKGHQLDRHHVYWQEKSCCVWDEDAQGYYAMIDLNHNKNRPNWYKHYIKGDPNKFVLLTAEEHGIIQGSKKSGKDMLYWVKYFEDLIEKRESEGKPCYLSKEDYEVYKDEHADVIAYYTAKTKPVQDSK